MSELYIIDQSSMNQCATMVLHLLVGGLNKQTYYSKAAEGGDLDAAAGREGIQASDTAAKDFHGMQESGESHNQHYMIG